MSESTSSDPSADDARRERPPLVALLGEQRARSLRRLLLAAIALLYLASVPWYRDTGGALDVAFGLPDWVAVAIGCYVGVAILNAIAWQLTEVSDPVPLELPRSEDEPMS
ncbi:MAG: hypothetical protein QF570_17445 [Myxococcota bacterium]|nr:hypothetical protein [Myxococcota bacterium]